MARTVIAARYELDDLPIGRGGMGEVWGGYDQRLDRRVAVKFIRFPGGRPDDELVRRFVRESRITARLEHPGVPVVYDAGTHDGDLFLVMQLVRGVSVADLVAEHERLPASWAAVIAAQACAVLSIAHVRSLVHRDLKPTNLMLCADGTVKVLDFGLAAAFEPTDISTITKTGETLGTPSYMAPEQALSGVMSPQSDLYSLGCVLHEMLTGHAPFTAATPLAVMHQHLGEQPRSPRELRPQTPAVLDDLVLRLLAKKPEDRPENATEVYRTLLPFATDLGPMPGAQGAAQGEPAEPDAVRMYATVVGRVGASGGAEGVRESAWDEPPASAEPPLRDDPDGSGAAPLPGGAPAPARGVAPGAGSARPPSGPPSEASRTSGDGAAGAAGSGPGTTTVGRSELQRARKEASELTKDARFSQAAEVLSGVAEQASVALGAHDTDVVSLRLELADVLFLGGDYRRAAPAFRQLAGDLARRDGPDGELVLRCRLQEATCHAVAGETGTALRQLRGLLGDEKRVFGPDDERTLELRRQIGLLLLGSGDTEEARGLLSDLLSDLVRVSGPDHPSARNVRELLANLDR